MTAAQKLIRKYEARKYGESNPYACYMRDKRTKSLRNYCRHKK